MSKGKSKGWGLGSVDTYFDTKLQVTPSNLCQTLQQISRDDLRSQYVRND